MDPAQFYTGIVAELYAPLRSATPDPDIYAGFIGAVGEPALEGAQPRVCLPERLQFVFQAELEAHER